MPKAKNTVITMYHDGHVEVREEEVEVSEEEYRRMYEEEIRAAEEAERNFDPSTLKPASPEIAKQIEEDLRKLATAYLEYKKAKNKQ